MATRPSVAIMKHRMVRWVLFLSGIYLAVVMFFTLWQRSLIYHPHTASSLPARQVVVEGSHVRDVVMKADDGLDLHGWHFTPEPSQVGQRSSDDGASSPATDRWMVLYFSGNAGHRGYRIDEALLFNQLNCDVLLFDYRGFGDNLGDPSESAFAADAHACWRYATQQCGVSQDRILVCGESLGGGVAVRLVAELCQRGDTPGGLILRETFPSLVEVAGWHYPWLPVEWAMVDRYPSRERIVDVQCPILQFHGDRDSIVPHAMGRQLFESAPAQATTGVAKRFVSLAGTDHNNVLERAGLEVESTLSDWLRTIERR